MMRSLFTGLSSGLLFLYSSAIISQEPLLVPFAEPLAAPEAVVEPQEEPLVKREVEPELPARPAPAVVQDPILTPPQPRQSVLEPLLTPPHQSPNAAPEYSPPARREERPRIANTEALIYQRAAFLAQQRTYRLETRKWTGNSAQRPTVPVTTFYTDLNHPLGWPYDWGYIPVWYVR